MVDKNVDEDEEKKVARHKKRLRYLRYAYAQVAEAFGNVDEPFYYLLGDFRSSIAKLGLAISLTSSGTTHFNRFERKTPRKQNIACSYGFKGFF